jgi:hypothetical protein
VLDHGEYVRLIRGRIDNHDGRLADWVTLVTSNLRSVTLGKQECGASPKFSFIAASGYEICGVEASEDGSVTGILQRPLQGEHSSTPAALFRYSAALATATSTASLRGHGASSVGNDVSM